MRSQDTLRLLTLWFEYGHMKVVEETLIEGFTTVSVDTWLQVIPQLIARIHSSVASVARLTHDLLTNVGRAHPQALVYPLSVASKSDAPARVTAANYILDKMREHSDSLVPTPSHRVRACVRGCVRACVRVVVFA